MEAANGVHEDVAALRSDARFAEVVCFLRTFSRVLRLRPVSCDELETALVAPSQWTALLAELHGRLCRRSHELAAPWREELEERWAVRLARYVGERKALWAGARESPLRGRAPPAAYAALTPVQRVRPLDTTRCRVFCSSNLGTDALCQLRLLHSLCIARLDSCTAVAEGIRLTVEGSAVHALRELPLGVDEAGCGAASSCVLCAVAESHAGAATFTSPQQARTVASFGAFRRSVRSTRGIMLTPLRWQGDA